MSDDTSRIADEAESARTRISATLDELGDRLSPRRIVGDAVGSVQASGEHLLDEGMTFLRTHPIAIAATGVAVGIALIGGSKLRSAKVDFGDASESYSDYEDDYEEHAPVNTERFALLRGSGSKIGDNPVIAIVVGLAAGALLGALFPETERERRLLGTTSDRMAAAAKAAARAAREEIASVRDKAGDITSTAKSAVQSVVEAAKGELKTHG